MDQKTQSKDWERRKMPYMSGERKLTRIWNENTGDIDY